MIVENIIVWIIFPIFLLAVFCLLSGGFFWAFHNDIFKSGLFRVIEVENYDEEDISKVVVLYRAEAFIGKYLWLIPVWRPIDLGVISNKYCTWEGVFEIEDKEELETIVEKYYRNLQKENDILKKRPKLKKPKVIKKFSLQ